MNKHFNHDQLINELKNVDTKKHHSIGLILDKLNGEELIGTPYDEHDTFTLEPITSDIEKQFIMLDKTLNYETIFRSEDEQGKDWALEYGLLSSKKYDDCFLICLQSIGRDFTDTILEKYDKSQKDFKSKITDYIHIHFESKSDAKHNWSRDVYLSKGYNWDLDRLFVFLKKILVEKKKSVPKDYIAIWKHRENQKKLTYERIKYFS